MCEHLDCRILSAMPNKRVDTATTKAMKPSIYIYSILKYM